MTSTRFSFLSFLFLLFIACSDSKTGPQEGAATATVYPEFVSELTASIEKDPENAALYFDRAGKLFAEGHDSLAYLDAKKAVTLKPENASYHFLYGNIAYERNDIAESQIALKRAIELDPSNAEYSLRLARTQFDLKDFEASNTTLENLSAKIGETPGAYFIFGLIKKELGDTASAVSNFQKVVALDNEHFDAYMQLGILLGAQKNKLGIDYLNNAVRIKPQETLALYARGKLKQDLGYYKEAVKDYDLIITVNPDYAPAYYNVGWINFRVEKYEPAIEYFNKAIIADDSYADAYYMRGLSYQALGNGAEAIRNYDACLKLKPDHNLAKEMKAVLQEK